MRKYLAAVLAALVLALPVSLATASPSHAAGWCGAPHVATGWKHLSCHRHHHARPFWATGGWGGLAYNAMRHHRPFWATSGWGRLAYNATHAGMRRFSGQPFVVRVCTVGKPHTSEWCFRYTVSPS